MLKYLFIDTETTGLPFNQNLDAENTANWPRMVQVGFILTEGRGVLEQGSILIRPDGFTIPWNATRIHGISTEEAMKNGISIDYALLKIELLCREADVVVGHNIYFDEHVIDAELCRAGKRPIVRNKRQICTMLESRYYCDLLPNYKWPTLSELYGILFNQDIDNAHDALADITATYWCFWELVDLGQISEPKASSLYVNNSVPSRTDSNDSAETILSLIFGILIWLIISWIL